MKNFKYSQTYELNLYELKEDVTFGFMLNGSYGVFYKNFLLSIDRQSIFLDIGANMGLYSLIAAKNNNIQNVFSVEPVREIAKIIKLNALQNKLLEKINILNVAIANKPGVQKIKLFQNHSGGATMRDVFIDKEFKEITIQSKNYEYLNNAIKTKFDVHVKVDVEGLEEQVLEQVFKTTWAPQIKSIFLEMDSRFCDVESLKKILVQNGFEETYNTLNKNDDLLVQEDHYDAMYERK